MKYNMRVGIDARVLQTGLRNKGIGTYTYNLIKKLIELNTKHEFIFYVFKNEPIPEMLREFELIKVNRYKRLNFIWQQFTESKGDIDIFHTLVCLGPTREIILPYFQRIPTIATIYDLNLMHLNDEWPRYFSRTRDYRIQLRSIKKVSKIITISNYVKKDIINTLYIDKDKIEIIYPGISTNVFKQLEDTDLLEHVKQKYNISSRFLFAVGEQPNKNIGVIFRVLRELRDDIQLVVVGKKENCKEIYFLKDLRLENRVIFTNEIPEKELVIFYNLAALLIFPSLAEGFGLPVLEAMACGCPVVASNAWSLPEVVGTGGLMFSPYDIKGMANAIIQILTDKKFKKELIMRGFEQAKKFSWQKCAKETLELYEEVINS
ncbi:glycosyltransferase family 4 protein [candidate division WOR-3 bacterium]|nr:glycosyltransferase family 4 protein [candidate division WOR-3 bacterium]